MLGRWVISVDNTLLLILLPVHYFNISTLAFLGCVSFFWASLAIFTGMYKDFFFIHNALLHATATLLPSAPLLKHSRSCLIALLLSSGLAELSVAKCEDKGLILVNNALLLAAYTIPLLYLSNTLLLTLLVLASY